MTTYSQITADLGACERQIFAARIKSEERVQVELERLVLVEKRRQELLETHERLVEEALGEHQRHLACVLARAGQEMEAASLAKAQALRRQRMAEARATATEKKMKDLERRIHDVNQQLDGAVAAHEHRCRAMRQAADQEVEATVEDATGAVRSTASWAGQVQDNAFACIGRLAAEGREDKLAAPAWASDRSRFGELFHMVVDHTNEDGTLPVHDTGKGQVVQNWYGDWVALTAKVEKMAPETGAWSEAASLTMMPAKTDRPRSGDRLRQRTAELLSLPGTGGPRRPSAGPRRPSAGRMWRPTTDGPAKSAWDT